MPHYTIELIPLREGEQQRGRGIPEEQTRRFANLGEALRRADELYRSRDASAKGFRILNAGGELLHVWIRR